MDPQLGGVGHGHAGERVPGLALRASGLGIAHNVGLAGARTQNATSFAHGAHKGIAF